MEKTLNRKNKFLCLLLACFMLVSILMPLGSIIASAAANNAQSEDGAATYTVGGVDYELVKGAFKYTSAQYEEMNAYFYYSD